MLLKSCNKKQKQERKNNRLLYLVKNKLDCVEMLVSKSVMDGIIDHNEFLEIIKEKKTMIVRKMNRKLKLFKKIKIINFFFLL